MRARGSRVRRFFAPEVVQSSAMDCGPAALKCLFDGHGISISYDRLREVCQTDVDGTSIDDLEEVACQLGLDAEQVLMPAGHVGMRESQSLPSLVIMKLPSGALHFVVLWRRIGGWVQIMDPRVGRRWQPITELLEGVYRHQMLLPAARWRSWVDTQAFEGPIDIRLRKLGISRESRRALIAEARADPGPDTAATLDAAIRMVAELARAGGVKRGRGATDLMRALVQRGNRGGLVPEMFYSVLPVEQEADEDRQLLVRGAVVLRVNGVEHRAADEPDAAADTPAPTSISRALVTKKRSLAKTLLDVLRPDGFLAPWTLIGGAVAASLMLTVQLLLFRVLFEVDEDLGLLASGWGAWATMLALVATTVAVQALLAHGRQSIGRHIELRLRSRVLYELPRLSDRYFQSRLISDMASRAHALVNVRQISLLGETLARTGAGTIFTATALIWLDPASAVAVVIIALLSVALPLLLQSVVRERDLRVQTHRDALSLFYFDSLRGLVPIRSHGGEQAVRREHESLLTRWLHAGYSLNSLRVAIQALQHTLLIGLVIWLLLDHLLRLSGSRNALLFAFWALELVRLGLLFASALLDYPRVANVVSRVIEPIEVAEGEAREREDEVTREIESSSPGVAVSCSGVTVQAGGHTVLEDVDFTIEPGTDLAIVGSSGAGKSTLLGLLLGWYRPSAGELRVDGVTLDHSTLPSLRRQTAWIDPDVYLWNRALSANIEYGAGELEARELGWVLHTADLFPLLESLPMGLQTPLGESGARLSGGEGQRVRLARALRRRTPRLVILDEAFRGLDRATARSLMRTCRRVWSNATILYVTHDIESTRDFDRVIVMESGRIGESDSPDALLADRDSLYSQLLANQGDVDSLIWDDPQWVRWRLCDGHLEHADHEPNDSR